MFRYLWAAEPARRQRRRLGGWRQQLEAGLEEAGREEPGRPSRLAAGLLLEWADGGVSSQRLQEHMANAVADGLAHPMVSRLANVGAGQHAATGLLQLMEQCGVMGWMTVLPGNPVSHMVLPSAYIKLLSRDYPQEFSRRVGASTEKLLAFWTTSWPGLSTRSGQTGTRYWLAKIQQHWPPQCHAVSTLTQGPTPRSSLATASAGQACLARAMRRPPSSWSTPL